MNARMLLVPVFLLLSACSHAFESRPLNIVFVCQYGYAKSLVAALHFQRKAAANGLPVHVVARGLTPAPTVAPAIVSALAKEGFDVAQYRPVALNEADLISADRVISFAVDVPGEQTIITRIDDVPPLSEDYGKGRDRIIAVLDKLVAELLREQHQIETD